MNGRIGALESRRICNPKCFATDTFNKDMSVIIFFLTSYLQDLRGGRSLDRRIILAIFQNQRRSGNDRQDHEGWS